MGLMTYGALRASRAEDRGFGMIKSEALTALTHPRSPQPEPLDYFPQLFMSETRSCLRSLTCLHEQHPLRSLGKTYTPTHSSLTVENLQAQTCMCSGRDVGAVPMFVKRSYEHLSNIGLG